MVQVCFVFNCSEQMDHKPIASTFKLLSQSGALVCFDEFKTAHILTKQVTTLYSRCQQLLSKQQHYDWGIRAVKAVLMVTGSLRSADPNMSEETVLMCTIRDFNILKIITADMPNSRSY